MVLKRASKRFFKPTTQVFAEYQKIIQWDCSKSYHYIPRAIQEFLSATEADAFLVACALKDKDNITIVTKEISNSHQKNKNKIPEVCNAFDIKFCNTIEMFREIKETF